MDRYRFMTQALTRPKSLAELVAEYLRLSKPASSYWLYLDGQQRLRWLDRSQTPPRVYEREPEASWLRRTKARIAGWLPIESQL